jgi:outer membrane protein
VAVQLGIDIDVAPNWFINADLRYIDIESDAKLNGVKIGTVEIDPWVLGLTLGTRF